MLSSFFKIFIFDFGGVCSRALFAAIKLLPNDYPLLINQWITVGIYLFFIFAYSEQFLAILNFCNAIKEANV